MKRFLIVPVLLAVAACSSAANGPPQPLTPPAPVVVTPTPTPTPAPSPVSSDPLTQLITKLNAIAIPDLQAALADAQAKGDTVAAQCYGGLIPILQGVQANPPIVLPPKPIGIVTAFQDARDIKAEIGTGGAALASLRKAINLACGALFVDVQAGAADPLSLFSGQ